VNKNRRDSTNGLELLKLTHIKTPVRADNTVCASQTVKKMAEEEGETKSMLFDSLHTRMTP